MRDTVIMRCLFTSAITSLCFAGFIHAEPAIFPSSNPDTSRQNVEVPEHNHDVHTGGSEHTLDESLTSALRKFNSKIAIDGLFTVAGFSDNEHLNFGDHDPKENGFNIQAMALNFSGGIDSYFTAEVNINTFIDRGETKVEFEEGFLTTEALPYNLDLMGGQFFTRFGSMNTVHAHAWDFVDQPVILNRFFGPDGLRGPGLQASWLLPTPFHLKVVGSAQQAGGEIAVSFLGEAGGEVGGHVLGDRRVKRAGDILYMPRVVSAFDLTDVTTLNLGASALFGPNSSSPDARTHIYGVDMNVKWQPRGQERGDHFVRWNTEFLFRDYEAGADEGNSVIQENLHDWGLYSQLLYGFNTGWATGLRFEYVNGRRGLDQVNDDLRSERYRVSPNISWDMSPFSRLRLQYNLDLAESRGHEGLHGFFLQWGFALGEHGAHRH